MRWLLAVLGLAGCGASKGAQSDGSVAAGGVCRTEADCGGATPYCDPGSGTCVECRFSSHCGDRVCEANHCRAAKSCGENYTQVTADVTGKTEAQACGAQSPRLTDNGSIYRGDDSMEVYVR